jgi:hypothetical protein
VNLQKKKPSRWLGNTATELSIDAIIIPQRLVENYDMARL